jgi:hypothetical protein
MIDREGTTPSGAIKNAIKRLSSSTDPTSNIDVFDAEIGGDLATYLEYPAYGLFFDPTRNQDAWQQAEPLPVRIAASARDLSEALKARFSTPAQGDGIAETYETSTEEIDAFRDQIEDKNYEVADAHATAKTRGSAQKVFAEAVKRNYGFKCAITGIKTRNFLVAAHFVPWSKD